ncbi:hypothetical protein ESZ50_07360 [Weissella muntiaci]|uniref:Uncharacterized protein n=1 Tax=Weissella muntiaci TaxID=2508881 RepID=A0A6C2C6T3_9LACO|nr:hypothetical protein [Weissella muntiaci]TYC49055.1 hypothetical protein ESZ50_07360 [Weissella muntiaci]
MDNLQEQLKSFVYERFWDISGVKAEYYLIETMNFSIDEMSIEQVPSFLDKSSDKKVYGITYASGVVKYKEVSVGVMVASFDDLGDGMCLGLAYLEDNTVIAEKKQGAREWMWL